MEQLIDVMGEKRLKTIARKNRRARNQKIREGKVVLNERGEWVDREWYCIETIETRFTRLVNSNR